MRRQDIQAPHTHDAQDKDRGKGSQLAEGSKRNPEQNIDDSEVQLPKVFLIPLPITVQVLTCWPAPRTPRFLTLSHSCLRDTTQRRLAEDLAMIEDAQLIQLPRR